MSVQLFSIDVVMLKKLSTEFFSDLLFNKSLEAFID
jgi:hypothetical protein